MDLNERIAAALGDADHASPWSELMRLFETDREAVYLLATHGAGPGADGAGPGADPRTQQLAALAGDVRSAIADTYEMGAQISRRTAAKRHLFRLNWSSR